MESLAGDLRQMQRTPLHEDHVAAMRRVGVVRQYAAGHRLFDPGTPMDRFVYLLSGELEMLDDFTGLRAVSSTLGPTQFVGDIAFLSGSAASMPMRAVSDIETLEVARQQMLALMSQIPEMSDIIISVMSARRRRQIEDRRTSLKLIGADRSPEIRRIAEFAHRNKIAFESLELDDPQSAETLARCGLAENGPAVIFGRDRPVSDPTPLKIAELLGMDLKLQPDDVFDVVIVGGGPAGVAAAVYAGAEGLRALVVEDVSVGGQAGTSSRIENYMGFPTGISGSDLVWRGEVQAMKFGSRFAMPRRATALARRDDGSFCVTLDEHQPVCTKAVIIATGVQYRRLPIARLEEFEGSGVYYAATDMEARFCRNTDAVVIGGGNSAGQAAMFLSRAASHVHLLVRGDSLAASMSDYLRSRLEADPRISIHYRHDVAQLDGDRALTKITVHDRGSDTQRCIDSRALFVMVGAAPNTRWLQGQVELDEKGFVKTGAAVAEESPFATSVAGVFAVGDVRAGSVKRVASAVGEGSVVISKVWSHVFATP